VADRSAVQSLVYLHVQMQVMGKRILTVSDRER